MAQLNAASAQTPGTSVRRYRAELQGLRALAVVLVVAYHVWFNRVSGGVDVFFVITGFLVIGQLYRAGLGGGIRLRPMWGRMIKRLFPAALTVLVAVMAACLVWLPEHRWMQTIREVFAAALYWENWQLVSDSADYFAANDTASVVQHFWSLSIQGQFYLVMPVLATLLVVLARKLDWTVRTPMALTVGGLFVVSLAYSVVLTDTDQQLAYFHSLTRVWEFMLGGLLALCIGTVTLPRALRIVLGWAGVSALVVCGFVLPVEGMFPGYAALWPTLAAVAVLLAGATGSKAGVDRWLSSRPLKFLGDISYALYLWHWPVLVLYLTYRDQETAGLRGGAFVIGLSLALAVATHYLVEEPARKAEFGASVSGGAYRFGVAMLAGALAIACTWLWFGYQRIDAYAVTAADPERPGAMALVDPELTGKRLVDDPGPSLIGLNKEFATLPDPECYESEFDDFVEVCSSAGSGDAKKRIVVVGDSHAQQNLAALVPLADRNQWEIISMVRGGCPFSVHTPDVAMNADCAESNPHRISEIKKLRPDAVVTMGSYQVRKGQIERTPEGFVRQWRELSDAGIPVVALRDHPRFDYDPAKCATEHGVDSTRCSEPRDAFYLETPPYERIKDMPSGVHFVDLSDYYCEPDRCVPVIGNVWVYMDYKHVSSSYLRTMAPILEKEIVHTLGW